jgi:hypothetical protein
VRPFPFLCIRSLTPDTIIIAAQHAAPFTYTPWDKQMWFSNETKNKGKTIKMSWILIQISGSQWLITIKVSNWPLGFSISPLMSPLTTKTQSLNLESDTPWSTARRPEANEKLKKVI